MEYHLAYFVADYWLANRDLVRHSLRDYLCFPALLYRLLRFGELFTQRSGTTENMLLKHGGTKIGVLISSEKSRRHQNVISSTINRSFSFMFIR